MSTYSRDQKHFQFRSVPLRLVSVPFRNAVDLPPFLYKSDRHVYTYVRNETLIRLMRSVNGQDHWAERSPCN